MLFRALIQTGCLTSLLLAATLSAATTASAQNGGGGPCREDAKKLCPEAFAARDRQAAKICLTQQMDKVSPACAARLQEAGEK